MNKWIIILCSLALFGCAGKAKLATSEQSYTEYRYIIDERNAHKQSSLVSSNQLKTLVGVVIAPLLPGEYYGTYQYETTNMSPLSDGEFSIPPILALDMKFDELFKISGQQSSPVHLHTLIIRSKEKFLGQGPNQDHADCEIELSYMNIPFRVYDETDLSSYHYEKTLGSFVNRCIGTIVGQIGDNNRLKHKITH